MMAGGQAALAALREKGEIVDNAGVAPELRSDERGLALVSGKTVVRADFMRMLPRLKPGNLNRELLVRAAKLKRAQNPPLQDAPQQARSQQGHPLQGSHQQNHLQQGIPLQDIPQQGHPLQDAPQQARFQQNPPLQDVPRQSYPLAIDATAGLGEDALLLAAAGFRVVLFERNPIIAALLRDALERAASVPELSPIVARMQLVEADSIPALQRIGNALAADGALATEKVSEVENILAADGNSMSQRVPNEESFPLRHPATDSDDFPDPPNPHNPDIENQQHDVDLQQPDIVLLDPMFPNKHNRAAAKKNLQLLQQLEEPCEDEESLLQAAFAARPRKAIVKRPIKGPYLAGRKPSYTLSGKAIRYDCHVLPRP